MRADATNAAPQGECSGAGMCLTLLLLLLLPLPPLLLLPSPCTTSDDAIQQ